MDLYQLIKDNIKGIRRKTNLYYIELRYSTDLIIDFDTFIYMITHIMIGDYIQIYPIDINDIYNYTETHNIRITYDTLIYLNISTSDNIQLFSIKGDSNE